MGCSPIQIQFIEDKSSPLPPDTLQAGDRMKWVSCVVLDLAGRELDSAIQRDLKVQVTLRVLFIDNSKEETLYTNTSESYYKPAKLSFKDLDCFAQVGGYLLQLHAEWDGKRPEDKVGLVVDGSEYSSKTR